MRTFIYLYTIFVLALMTGCNSNKPTETNSGLWDQFEGTWYNSNSGTFEEWYKSGDELQGKAFKIEDNDTLIIENLRILSKSGEFYYEATVYDQNEGFPVLFKMASHSDHLFTFENPDHTFPQKLIYDFVSKNNLNITISGEIEDLEKEFMMAYHKVKSPPSE